MLILVHFLIWTNIVVRREYFRERKKIIQSVELCFVDAEVKSHLSSVEKNLKKREKRKLNAEKNYRNIMKVNRIQKSLKQINAVLRNKIISAKQRLHKLLW